MAWYLEEYYTKNKIPLVQGITSIGRTPICTVQLDSTYCSRAHCNIHLDSAGNVNIQDFSSNGTFVNGERYENQDKKVEEGDKIGIGCWPFEGIDWKDPLPIYVLRKEQSSVMPSARTSPAVNEIVKTEEDEIIAISDDDDDLNLQKYVCEVKSKSAETGTTNGEPQFLRPTAPVIGLDMDIDSDPQFLPSTSAVQPSNGRINCSSGQPIAANLAVEDEHEEMDIDMAFSQSTVLDIKQEVADLDLEQSFEIQPEDLMAPNYGEKGLVASTQNSQFEQRTSTASSNQGGESPIFIIDDDDEEEQLEEEKLSIWATKLSQSFNSTRPDPAVTARHDIREKENDKNERHRDTSAKDVDKLSKRMERSLSLEDISDEDVQQPVEPPPPVNRMETRQSLQKVDETKHETKTSPKPGSSKQIDEVDHDFERPVTKKHRNDIDPEASTSRRSDSDVTHLELKRKRLTVIDAPNLRTGRGKLRGHTLSVVSETEKKVQGLRLRDRITNQEKTLQAKWQQKPSLERAEQKQRQQSIQEERKLRLKELAEKQSQKRKLENEEYKAVKKPKVKVTQKTRGAFLAEELDYNKAKNEVLSKRIPKLQSTDSVDKGTAAQPSTSGINKKDGNARPAIKHGESLKQRSDHSKRSDDSSKTRRRESTDSSKRRESTESNKRRNSTDSNKRSRKRSCSDADKKQTFEEALLGKASKASFPRIMRYNSSSSGREENNDVVSKPQNRDKENTTPLERKPATPRRKTCDLKSILQSPAPRAPSKPKRSVKFSDKIEIRYFDIESESSLGRKVNCKEVPDDLGVIQHLADIQKRTQEHRPAVDFTEKILNDVLGWNPEWLTNGNAEINGRNHMLMPMVQQYKSFDDFSRIVLPLFKIELWHSIQKDYEHRSKANFLLFKVNQFIDDPRGRYVFHCEVNAKAVKDRVDYVSQQLCLIRAENRNATVQLFGIVTSMRCLSINGNNDVLSIQLELKANPKYKSILERIVNIGVKSITSVRVDVGVFNAITNLQFSRLGACILNPFELVRSDTAPPKQIHYKGYNDLNTTQQAILLEAYQRCIDSKKTNNLYLIEGPPGTGKSRIITNLALQILYGYESRSPGRNKKILICAQSNAAIDIIAHKLLDIRGKMERDKFNLVRFGVYERISENVRCISIQALVQSYLRVRHNDANRNILRQERKLLEAQIVDLSADAGPDNVSRNELQKKKDRLTMINQLLGIGLPMGGLEQHYPRFLTGADIVCTTLSSCINLLNYMKKFDVCIIDEATQCAEPYTLIPLQFGISSLILVGDTQQLPATVLSRVSEEYGFGRSLFTRIQECLKGMKNVPIQMLKTQYRMHPEICLWSNTYFYKNALINHESTNTPTNLVKPYAVLGLEYNQNNGQEKGKLSNEQEAKFIVDLVSHLAQVMSPEYFSYGIITPYAHHKDYLQKKIVEAGLKKIMVNTIDSYQGKEKDIIILSCVRTRGIGFLGNCQRLNVALTRAKKCLFVCGNFTSLMREPVWKSLLENAKRRELYFHIKQKDTENFDNKVMCHLKNNLS